MREIGLLLLMLSGVFLVLGLILKIQDTKHMEEISMLEELFLKNIDQKTADNRFSQNNRASFL